MINQMLFKESKTARTNRSKESLLPQAVTTIITYLFLIPLTSFVCQFASLFLTQRVNAYFVSLSQNAQYFHSRKKTNKQTNKQKSSCSVV